MNHCATATAAACTFCRLITHEPEKILSGNERLVVIADKHRVAEHHYLVITRKHIRDVNELTSADASLVDEMDRIGQDYMRSQVGTDYFFNHFRGFHLPPRTSVDHLHMYFVYKASEVNDYNKWRFQEPSAGCGRPAGRFVTPMELSRRLRVHGRADAR